MIPVLPPRRALGLLFAVFALSGFAGLVYESIWSHYLKLFLGHAGYAQTLVLAIFMGGMAAGAWLAARCSRRWRNLLLGYAVVEAAIGVLALVFHEIFIAVTEATFDLLLPGLASPGAAAAAKWALGAALILPQSVLLGMTFPLMSGGLIRRYPATPGAALAMLYFTNSLGAGIGVLVAGFVMIERLGLPGTVQAAGIVNLAVAALVLLLARLAAPEERPQIAAPGTTRRDARLPSLLLAVAALTGAASFIYEIAWIRMLTLVLGAATHSFELMLSAFILGLAFGGLWIRGRIDRSADPRRFLGVVQIVMGLAALATLPLYGKTFELMQNAMLALARTDNGYALFHVVGHGIALLVMFPAAFCAGMTLPLITYALLKQGYGERSIGAVYAANTLGAIAGVVLAAHVGLPVLGLKTTVVLGAAIDVGLGIVLLWTVLGATRAFAAAAGLAVAALMVCSTVQFDAYRMMSGVFRYGRLFTPQDAKLLFYRDGRTASVSLVDFSDGRSIRTNGKSDGGVNMNGPPLSDETTMTLTAVLPLAVKPEARRVAVIGIGTGITTHTLLGNFALETVDTIEIEPAMAEASRGFSPRNSSAFADPRSHIRIDDAKTYFSTHNRRYDVIISEPSNPWVSGVASLFTVEFYRMARRHLEREGVLVQWVQLYETDVALIASVVGALAQVFPDYVIYVPNDKDILIVAGEAATLARPLADVFRLPGLEKELRTVNLRAIGDLDMRRLGGRRALEPLFASYGAPPNSDYYPHVDLNAPRLRFLRSEATDLVELGSVHAPIVALFDDAPPARPPSGDTGPEYQKGEETRRARHALDFLLSGKPPVPVNIPHALQKDLELVQIRLLRCVDPDKHDSWLHALFQVGKATIPYLTLAESRALWQKVAASPCVAALPPEQRRWITMLKAAAGRDLDVMAAAGEELLAHPAAALESSASRRYLLATTMAANLALGKGDVARTLWQRYERELKVDGKHSIELRFVAAHALAGR